MPPKVSCEMVELRDMVAQLLKGQERAADRLTALEEKMNATSDRKKESRAEAGRKASATRATAFVDYVTKYLSVFPLDVSHDTPETRLMLAEGRTAVVDAVRYQRRFAAARQGAGPTFDDDLTTWSAVLLADNGPIAKPDDGKTDRTLGATYARLPYAARVYFVHWALLRKEIAKALDEAGLVGLQRGLVLHTRVAAADRVERGGLKSLIDLPGGILPAPRIQVMKVKAEKGGSADDDDDDDARDDAKGGAQVAVLS